MKLSKKQIGIIAGLACAILLIVLLLTMCNGSGYGDHQGEPTESSVPVESTAAPTEASEETTDATEETTEATEEPTEETEEPTEPTTGSTGGNTRPGGTGGYNPGGSGGSGGNDDSSGGAATEKAPEAGSENSPYVEAVAQFPDAFSSVQIPTDSTVYHHVYGAEGGVLVIEDEEAYVIYNGVTYEPDDYGVVQVPFAAAEQEEPEVPEDDTEEELNAVSEEENTESDADTEEQPDTEETPEPEALVLPQIFQLGSKSAEARSFLLTFRAPLGNMENPMVLESFDGVVSVEAALESGDTDGYYYSYTAANNGLLTLQVESITENVPCDIIVTAGDVVQKLSECEDGILKVNLMAEETILIQVVVLPGEDGTYPAAEIKILGQIEDKLGSKVNPIMIPGEFPIVTETLEPGAEVYYSVYGAGGMILTVADPDAYVIVGEETWTAVEGVVTGEVVSANPREPVLIGVGNGGETAESYTVEFRYKPGSMMNPAPLVLDEINTVVIPEGSTDGYWYTWTAEKDGILTLAMPEGNWMYLINNVTAAVYGENQYSDAEDASILVETEVAAGDELQILICTYDPAVPFEIPAGEVVFSATFNTKVGTMENPFWLLDEVNTVEVLPGCQFACNEVLSGVDMVITGEGSFMVTYNGENFAPVNGVVTIPDVSGTRFAPIPVLIANYGTVTTTYTISFVSPLGSNTNPQIIDVMGEYAAAVDGDGSGYFYNWTAPADGEFTISMQGDDWTFVVNNLTTFAYGELHSSADGSDPSETVTVAAGDQIQINVATASGMDKTVSLTVDFLDPTYGTEENPVWLTETENTVTVRPGTTVYANVVLSNVTMTVAGTEEFELTFNSIDYVSENGVVTIHGVNASRFTPLLLTLTNPGTETALYTVSFAYPVGSFANPDVLVDLGEHTAPVVGEGEGYIYSWTSNLDGVFTIQMLGDDWTYSVSNLTTFEYGDIYSSADGSPANGTVSVKTGDEIQINIGTSSRQNKDVTMVFDAYDPNVGTEENPLWLLSTENTVTVRPGKTFFCNVALGGTNMTVRGDGDFSVTFNGEEYTAENGIVQIDNLDASRFAPKQMVFTNSGEKNIHYTVAFAYPTGSSMNPEILTQMGEYTAVVVGDGEGYFYSWIAEADGEFTITMHGDDWVYVMNNLTSYHYGGFRDSMTAGTETETISVKTGDEIQINIGTVSRQNKDVSLVFSFQEVSEIIEFTGSYTPKPFEINLEEEVRQMGPVDLTEGYKLVPSKAGIYHLHEKSGPLLLLDFTDDTYVNLKELVESMEITIEVTAADGTVTTQRCNELLKRYIECAWVVKVSDEVTRTLYPLTEDLELILKSLGQQLGWFDPDSDGYLFAQDDPLEDASEETVSQEIQPLEEESLWMFACSYVEFIMEEEEIPADESAVTSAEETEEPAESDAVVVPFEESEEAAEADETVYSETIPA